MSIFFLQGTLLTRQKQSGPREVLQHVTIMDEAQNVFRPEARWEDLSLPSKTIREVREYGECILAATQQTDVSDSLLANTGTKILMRTNAKPDLEYFSKCFQVDPYWITKIPNGQAVAVIPDRYHRAFLFSFAENTLKNRQVSDDDVTARYAAWRAGIPAAAATSEANSVAKPALGPKELALLRDVASNPLVTTTQHYERLGWNPKIGNQIKERLQRQSLLDVAMIEAGRSRTKILTLTTMSTAILTSTGATIKKVGPGSIEHEYWRSQLHDLLTTSGYVVTEEYPLGRQRVDLHATRDERVLLFEIETGKSDIRANIEKCEGHGQLLMFFTTRTAYDAARAIIPAHVRSFTPETITNLTSIIH